MREESKKDFRAKAKTEHNDERQLRERLRAKNLQPARYVRGARVKTG